MLIHSASQLLTISKNPQRGKDLGHLGIIEDGAVLIEDDIITAVGPSDAMCGVYEDHEMIDAGGRVVMPGFVDPHTHLVWAGDRAAEFEMRLQGKTYLEIMVAGGGILSTVRQTRQAELSQLVNDARERLKVMFSHGTTTAEAKTGYGLEIESELKLLKTILILDREGPIELAPTFLGAHALPPEYKDDSSGYTELVCHEMLPRLKAWWPTQFDGQTMPELPYVDVFCETGAFSFDESRQILEKASELGFPLKIHADEFDNLGGVSLASRLGAVSADHLVVTSQNDIKTIGKTDTVAVSLPCTPFGLAEGHYSPAKELLEANAILAIATDLNPGTAWCGNMQFSIALSCRYMQLTPAQAIVAATLNAAAAIGRESKVGSLQPGKQADIIILDIPDYRHLGYRFGSNLIWMVVKSGKPYLF
jgi:imidazolonepropionase